MNNRYYFLRRLFLLLSLTPAPLVAQEPVPPRPAAGTPVLKLDFQSTAPGEVPEEVTVTDAEAKFTVTEEGSNRMLEMAGLPLVDGGVLLGQAVKGPVTVVVRARASGKRRSHPRFGAGLHGAGGYRCLVVPAMKEVQIVKNDEVLARVPFTWKSGAWTWIELSVLNGKDAGAQVEARVWEEGQIRPEVPTVTAGGETAPGNGKASLWATPYAELPIVFDDVTVTPG